MPTAENTHTTPDIPRTLRHLDTDEIWAERDTASKLHVTAVDASHRLRGMADVLFGLGLTSGVGLHQLSFLGAALKDISLSLERVTKAQMAEWNAADFQKPAKRGKKPGKSARRAAA
jgi:hypothetical protein